MFNPRLDSLTRLFYLIEYHRPLLFEAFLKYKDLDKKAMKQYAWHYGDTAKLYNNINLLYNEIDNLILQHNEIKNAVDSAYSIRKEAFEIYFKAVNINDENTPSNIKKLTEGTGD